MGKFVYSYLSVVPEFPPFSNHFAFQKKVSVSVLYFEKLDKLIKFIVNSDVYTRCHIE